MSIPFIEENDQTRARQEHLEALRELVGNAYPNKFQRSQIIESGKEDTITAIVEKFIAFEPKAPEGERPPAEAIELANQQLSDKSVRLAGRIATPPRVMGKAAFVHLSDGVTRLQIYVRKADAKAIQNNTGTAIEDEGAGWKLLELLDHGDFIGVEGYLFITKTGELSVHVQTLQFLAKALLPMPDKMHGVSDPEIKQRQRYVDLIAGSLKVKLKEEEEKEEEEESDGSSHVQQELEELTPRQAFERRSKIISEMRRFLEDYGYVEVETPMLTSKATGAAARAFETHHNALDIQLFARIAPELYLKRLLVGGFEKVYELNRNFRNEGIDRIHNPEFTMLEFYWAYADVNQMMDFCEELLRTTIQKVIGRSSVTYEREVVYHIGDLSDPTEVFEIRSHIIPERIDFEKRFRRLTMLEAIKNSLPEEYKEITVDEREYTDEWLQSPKHLYLLYLLVTSVNNTFKAPPGVSSIPEASKELRKRIGAKWPGILKTLEHQLRGDLAAVEARTANYIQALFEIIAEKAITGPVFITDYPKALSPLSKASPSDPTVAERFELFIAGMECANGFSELNDPAEQHKRFMEQMTQRERGDEEAMVMDEDYIRALSYGMPPAAGIGIGIDRFVMLLTNRPSIRDVILFPHMRPQTRHTHPDLYPETG